MGIVFASCLAAASASASYGYGVASTLEDRNNLWGHQASSGYGINQPHPNGGSTQSLKLELPPLMELVMVLDMDMERGASMELELLPPWRTATTCGVIRLLLVMESISLTLAVDPLSPSPSSTLELLPLKLE